MKFTSCIRTMVVCFILLGALLAAETTAAQTWIELNPIGGPPVGESGPASAHFDAANNRLIVFVPRSYGFGHAGLTPDLVSEVWVLTHANGLGGTPEWMKVEASGPAPRIHVTPEAVYDPSNNRLIVYGGAFFHASPVLNGAFVLTNANGLGGPAVWSQINVSNAPCTDFLGSCLGPHARTDHSAVYDAVNNLMITFGGNLAFFGTDHNDTRVLSNANGIVTPSTWTSLATSGGPPGIRAGHSATYDEANNTMTVFGGFHLISTCCPYVISNLNDVWVLVNANGLTGTPTWSQLAPAAPLPPGRGHHAAAYDSAHNRLFIFGGDLWDQAAQVDIFTNDLWELSYANGNGGTPTWTQLFPSGTPPSPRDFSQATFDVANQRMILVGGIDRNQTGAADFRVWVLVFNQPPVADAGADQTVDCATLGATPVTLDGSGSSDPDAGQTLTYTWTGPFPEGNGTVTGVSPTVSLPLGTHTIKLTVDDGNGGTSSDSVSVTVILHVEGLLAPLAALVAEGDTVPYPDKAFKLGRTLPLKLQLSCGGLEVTDTNVPPPRIVGLVRNGDAVDLATIDPDSGEANDGGILFRYSAPNWVFNLSTAGLSAGTYVVTIEMPDGQRYVAAFVLR